MKQHHPKERKEGNATQRWRRRNGTTPEGEEKAAPPKKGRHHHKMRTSNITPKERGVEEDEGEEEEGGRDAAPLSRGRGMQHHPKEGQEGNTIPGRTRARTTTQQLCILIFISIFDVYALRRRRRSSVTRASPTGQMRLSHFCLPSSNTETLQQTRARRPDAASLGLGLKSWAPRQPRTVYKSSRTFSRWASNQHRHYHQRPRSPTTRPSEQYHPNRAGREEKQHHTKEIGGREGGGKDVA